MLLCTSFNKPVIFAPNPYYIESLIKNEALNLFNANCKPQGIFSDRENFMQIAGEFLGLKILHAGYNTLTSPN